MGVVSRCVVIHDLCVCGGQARLCVVEQSHTCTPSPLTAHERLRPLAVVKQLTDRIAKLETHVFGATASEPPPQPSQPQDNDSGEDDDFDLFGSDDEVMS